MEKWLGETLDINQPADEESGGGKEVKVELNLSSIPWGIPWGFLLR